MTRTIKLNTAADVSVQRARSKLTMACCDSESAGVLRSKTGKIGYLKSTPATVVAAPGRDTRRSVLVLHQRITRLCPVCGTALTNHQKKLCSVDCKRKDQSQRMRLDPEPRFWANVVPGPIPECRPDLGPCLDWTGHTNEHGYGRISVNGRQIKTHVYAWERKHGPVPDGLELDHLCRRRICANDHHLEPVTHAVNSLRGMSPPAIMARKTHCIHGHEFSAENTHFAPRKNGRVSRQCRQCERAGKRARRAKAKVA